MRCIIVRYEIFQNLIAHFQSTLYELGDQIESLLDDQQREEIGNLMDRSDQLIHQALAQANRDDVTSWKERLESLRKCMLEPEKCTHEGGCDYAAVDSCLDQIISEMEGYLK